MTQDEKDEMIVLEYFKAKDSLVSPDDYTKDLHDLISNDFIRAAIGRLKVRGRLKESDDDTWGRIKIESLGIKYLEELKEKDKQEKIVAQVPQSVITTGNSVTTTNRNYWKWALPTLVVAASSVAITLFQYFNDRAELNLRKEELSKDSTQQHIQSNLSQLKSSVDSLSIQVQSVKANDSLISKKVLEMNPKDDMETAPSPNK